MDLILRRNAREAADQWLRRTICAPGRGTEIPRGRPLVRFRLTAQDNASLAKLLRAYLRPADTAPQLVAAVFCLFAIDTLRRRPAGGSWAWHDITAPLDATDVPQGDLRMLVSRGMAFWNRPLRTNRTGDRLYLGSLVIEAGIPATLLSRMDFADFLRQTQRDLDLYGASDPDAVRQLTEQNGHRLPGSWRNEETVTLAAELLWALQPVRDAWLRNGALPQQGELSRWSKVLQHYG